MMNYRMKIFILAGGLLIGSCQKKELVTRHTVNTTIKYATGFSLRSEGNVHFVSINSPYPGAKETYQYLLVPHGEEVPDHNDATAVIRTPVKTIVCTSTTHIPLLDYIGETESLIGFPTTDYISSEKMRQRIDAGQVTDLGIDKGMNLELLFSLKPELVMGYTMTSDLGQLKKIKELGIPVVINAEYLEAHPLGRAEWIKFMALFFDKWAEADSAFTRIETEYQATQRLASTAVDQPTVMSGIVYGDAWFMPAGKNYAAKLLEDAGTQYLWRDTESSGFLELSFESVYERAKDADLWIGVGSFQTLTEVRNADNRYGLFKPLQDGKVYSYNARKGAKGGSEFLELGYLRPDLILKDLVKIAHPELVPDYELFFHRELK
ncbi:MAG: ABC transporter substrate-binding protein [Cyclobacteriaceae bacterium]|nr:ABC transporter substrate-binding protein [Cyclobacteriaceae bacterium]